MIPPMVSSIERKVDDKGRVTVSEFGSLGHHVYASAIHTEGKDAIICYPKQNFDSLARLLPRERLAEYKALTVDNDHRINFNGFHLKGYVIIEGRDAYFIVYEKPSAGISST